MEWFEQILFHVTIFLPLQKKPIMQLKAASALNRIMVLCDNTLTLLNMFDLEVKLYVLYATVTSNVI